MSLDAFKAGWKAYGEVVDHEWGPQPPQTPELAYIQWMNTCKSGHLSFEIPAERHRVLKCRDCETLLKRGKFSAARPTAAEDVL